jgi:predicted transcriptional regulator
MTNVVSFRCEPEDKLRLERLARERRMSISSLVKVVLFQNLDWFKKVTQH